MNQPAIFHLAIPITDVSTAKSFYCDGLGCLAGRETEKAIILNFSGHQVVAHVTEMPSNSAGCQRLGQSSRTSASQSTKILSRTKNSLYWGDNRT